MRDLFTVGLESLPRLARTALFSVIDVPVTSFSTSIDTGNPSRFLIRMYHKERE